MSQIFTMIIVSVAYSIFTSVQGIYFNSKFPKFNWDNEVIVIKQSMSVILSGLVGMIFVAIPALVHWFSNIPLQMVLWGMVVILIMSSVVLYKKSCNKKII